MKVKKKSGKVYSYYPVYFNVKAQDLHKQLLTAGLTNLSLIDFVHNAFDDAVVNARIRGVNSACAVSPRNPAQSKTPDIDDDDNLPDEVSDDGED
jgi:hypothetical protein